MVKTVTSHVPDTLSADNCDRYFSEEKREELSHVFESCCLDSSIPTDLTYDKRTIQEERIKRYEVLSWVSNL